MSARRICGRSDSRQTTIPETPAGGGPSAASVNARARTRTLLRRKRSKADELPTSAVIEKAEKAVARKGCKTRRGETRKSGCSKEAVDGKEKGKDLKLEDSSQVYERSGIAA